MGAVYAWVGSGGMGWGGRIAKPAFRALFRLNCRDRPGRVSLRQGSELSRLSRSGQWALESETR